MGIVQVACHQASVIDGQFLARGNTGRSDGIEERNPGSGEELMAPLTSQISTVPSLYCLSALKK